MIATTRCHELVESKPPFMTLSATYEFLKLMEEAALYQFEKERHPIDMLSNDTILKELSDLNSSQRLALSMYIPVILMLGHEGPVMEDHNEFLKHKTKVIEMGSCIVARLPIELTSVKKIYIFLISRLMEDSLRSHYIFKPIEYEHFCRIQMNTLAK